MSDLMAFEGADEICVTGYRLSLWSADGEPVRDVEPADSVEMRPLIERWAGEP